MKGVKKKGMGMADHKPNPNKVFTQTTSEVIKKVTSRKPPK